MDNNNFEFEFEFLMIFLLELFKRIVSLKIINFFKVINV